jgi:hypothetical protein
MGLQKNNNNIPGLVLPSGQTLNLGLLATIAFEVVLFRAHAPLPELHQYFKCRLH